MRLGRLLLVAALLVFFSTGAVAVQPKIVEVQDNFGNVMDFTDAVERGATGAQPNLDQQIVVTDETEITLCVTEIQKGEDSTIYYFYDAGQPVQYGNSNFKRDNCNTWTLTKDQYRDHWSFTIYADNRDDYQVNNGNHDFRVVVHYDNLTLEGRAGNTTIYTYETVKVSKNRFDELKHKADQYDDLQKRLEQLQATIQEQLSTIQELRAEIDRLQNRINELERQRQQENNINISSVITSENRPPHQNTAQQKKGVFDVISRLFP